MVGTGGARKVRFPRGGKGKSGGIGTIHYFGGGDVPLFLLTVIDKGERANVSRAERNALAKLLPQLAEAYGAGVKQQIADAKRKNRQP